MKFRSEKGYTGIDIATSIVVLFIFVSLIAFLSYRFNSSANEIKLKAEATEIAMQEIEVLKNNLRFETIKDIMNDEEYMKSEIRKGFFEKVKIQDYADINSNKEPKVVKKVTVQIQYMSKGKEETVELSTIVAKES